MQLRALYTIDMHYLDDTLIPEPGNALLRLRVFECLPEPDDL